MKDLNNQPDPEVIKVRDQIIKKIGNKSLEEVNVIIKKLLNGQMDEITRLGALAARVKILRLRIEDLYENKTEKKLKKVPLNNIKKTQETVKQVKEEEWIKIKMLVASEVNGKQIDKDVILEIKKEDGDKLIKLDKAELIKKTNEDENSKKESDTDNKKLDKKESDIENKKEAINNTESDNKQKIDESIKSKIGNNDDKEKNQILDNDSKEKNTEDDSKKSSEVNEQSLSKQDNEIIKNNNKSDNDKSSDEDLLKLHEQEEVKKTQPEPSKTESDLSQTEKKVDNINNTSELNSDDNIETKPKKGDLDQSKEDLGSDPSLNKIKNEDKKSEQSTEQTDTLEKKEEKTR